MKNSTTSLAIIAASVAIIATLAATPILQQQAASAAANGGDPNETERKTSVSVFKQKEVAENVVSGVGNTAGIVKCQTQASGACGALTLTLP